MQSENIKFETVFDAIKHYQTEKGCLEETLRELRQKRSKLDECVAATTADQVKTASWRSQTAETLKIIQHRVTQMQTQLSNLRETSERSHEAIRSFHAEIENEKTRQMEESAAFDTQLEAVCEQLKSDWKFYAKENLCVLLADKVRAAQEVERKSKEVNDEVVEASRRLEKLKFDYDRVISRTART